MKQKVTDRFRRIIPAEVFEIEKREITAGTAKGIVKAKIRGAEGARVPGDFNGGVNDRRPGQRPPAILRRPSCRKSCKARNSQPIRSRRSFADRKYALAATVRPSAQLTRKTRLFRPPLSCSKASARVPQAFSSAASTFSSCSSFFIGRRNRPV